MKSQNRWHQIPLMEAGLLCREAVPVRVKTHSVNGSALRGACPGVNVALGEKVKALIVIAAVAVEYICQER